MLLADTVRGAANLIVAALVGMVVLVVGETDRIENQVIMERILSRNILSFSVLNS